MLKDIQLVLVWKRVLFFAYNEMSNIFTEPAHFQPVIA